MTHFDDPGPDYLLSLLLHRSGVKRPGKDLHVTFFLRRSSARDALAQHPKGGERAHHQPAALSVAHRQHAIACSRGHKSGFVGFLALRKERGKKMWFTACLHLFKQTSPSRRTVTSLTTSGSQPDVSISAINKFWTGGHGGRESLIAVVGFIIRCQY